MRTPHSLRCSTTRSGYRRVCQLQTSVSATDECVSYRRVCQLQTSVSATDERVSYRRVCQLQTSVSATDERVSYRRACQLQTSVSATDERVSYRRIYSIILLFPNNDYVFVRFMRCLWVITLWGFQLKRRRHWQRYVMSIHYYG